MFTRFLYILPIVTFHPSAFNGIFTYTRRKRIRYAIFKAVKY